MRYFMGFLTDEQQAQVQELISSLREYTQDGADLLAHRERLLQAGEELACAAAAGRGRASDGP